MGEETGLLSIKPPKDGQASPQEEEKRQHIIRPSNEGIWKHRLGKLSTRRTVLDDPERHHTKNCTCPQDKSQTSCQRSFPRHKKEADTGDENQGIEQPGNSPRKGNQIPIVRHCLNQPIGSKRMKSIHHPGAEKGYPDNRGRRIPLYLEMKEGQDNGKNRRTERRPFQNGVCETPRERVKHGIQALVSSQSWDRGPRQGCLWSPKVNTKKSEEKGSKADP